jgi:TonB family protein
LVLVRPLAVLALACALAAPARTQEQPLVAGESGVPIPKRIKMVKPVYPPDAQAHGLRGIVILDLTIDKNGKVAAVDVVRSIPGLDDAAVEAVKQWEYEPVKVDGKAVLVRLSVPITFLMPVPEISRQQGIPELRQGAVPAFPKGVEARGTVSAVAEVTIDPEGRVVEAELKGGAPPYSDALLQAVKTWLFTSDAGRGVMSFRVQADFVGGDRARVAVSLAGLRQSEALEAPAPAAPAPPPPPNPQATAGAEPPAAPPTPSPAVAPVAEPSPTPTPESQPQLPAAAPPVVEVLRQEPPPKPVESGISAVRDVTLGPGLPELSKGRRPVPPPFARMAGVAGTVRVRFAIDASGSVSIQGSDGPDLLRPAAEQAVVSWVFRRTATDRLRAVAEIVYRDDGAAATVKLEE